MRSISRLLARAGSALALLLGLALAPALPLRADAPPDLWFAGTRLVLEHPQTRAGEIAVASDDAGLARILGKAGATLSFDPKQKYVVVIAADRRTIVFTLDDPRFTVDGLAQTAPFAPYASGKVVYLPLMALARALYVDPLPDAGATILQPQLAWLEARSDGRVTIVTLRGATPLRFKRLSTSDDGALSLAFLGLASPLERQRQLGGASLRSIAISVSGSPRNPATVVSFSTAPGSVAALVPSSSPNEVAIAFGPPGVALGGTPIPSEGNAASAILPLSVRDPRATPPPAASSRPLSAAPSAAPDQNSATAAMPASPLPGGLPPAAQITAIDVVPFGQGLNVRVGITGSTSYEWHRLADNRWYVDFKNAFLAVPAQDQPLRDPSVIALRVRQSATDPVPVVRVALTLASPRQVDILPFEGGLALAVNPQDDLTDQRSGGGVFGAGEVVAAAPVAPDETPAPVPPAPPWKFGPSFNPKLIVIDPGHGGSDTGAMHNGLVEAELTLDISKRLRALLVSRGWQVKLTRDSDVDVFGANASARDELQARCDVANEAGARMFISIHVNSFTASGLNGTTTYYYKGTDLALAQALHRRLVDALGTKDDGVRKENFYVIHHTKMPAALIETAFLSNPDDASLLHSQAFLQKVAISIAEGVGDYASSTPAGGDGS